MFVVQSLSGVWVFATPWTAAHQAPLSFSISWSLLKFMSIDLMMLFHSLPSPSPFAFNLSQHRGLLQWVGSSHSFSISPSNEYLGLISCKTDWLYLLSVQGTLKNLLQHHNLKHQFFGAQPSLQVILHLHSYKYSRKKLISINKRW